jgi:hypothetical protein
LIARTHVTLNGVMAALAGWAHQENGSLNLMRKPIRYPHPVAADNATFTASSKRASNSS